MIDRLKDILLYHENTPLLFTRLYFWVFFAIVLAVYSIIYRQKAVRNAYLFLVSLFFYYKTSGFFVSILLVSTLTDFIIGKRIYATENLLGKKLWLALSIFINLFILTYFKYAYFFTDAFNTLLGTHYTPINHFAYWTNSFFGTHFRFDKILLPVGVSFFTFQTISYSVDVYRGLVKPVRNILDFGFFVSFFPQLVAGPIVRAADFVPQLYKDYSLTKEQFGIALFMILNGLVKKLFLADYIAVNFIDRVFTNPLSYTGFENLMALYGYSLQVYADFSGYTDIAIGLAMLMGFQLPKNFNSPYKATSTGEFWKR
ncbi:MAG: MBOAT family protein, partial [Cyclobacteriaceae bacterium]|nr:MBOAT family protein [Cyclobacteriaceae bacterium]